MAPNANSVKHKLMFVIGEIKELVQITVGYKLVIKHMPDCPFLLDARLGTQLLRSFATEFQARDMQRGVRLVAAFTILMKSLNDYRVDTMTVMMTTGNWIPVENDYEKAAADALTQAERRFINHCATTRRARWRFPTFCCSTRGIGPC
jgi:hypothetical protein